MRRWCYVRDRYNLIQQRGGMVMSPDELLREEKRKREEDEQLVPRNKYAIHRYQRQDPVHPKQL